MHTVAEFDEQGADIVLDGVKHLLEVVYLLRYLVVTVVLLGQYAHQESNVLAERLTDILDGQVGILHHIVQQGSDDGVGS